MKSKKKWTDYISLLAVVCSGLILIVVNSLWGTHWLDSDMAAEMIFSKLLSEEGRIFATQNWYYSTEFRVLYTQLIMTPLHYILNKWHLIRVITNVICYLLMLVSFFFAVRPLALKKRNVWLCSLALLIPISEAVMTHLQMGNTYMPHVILSFVTFGLFLRLCAPNETTKTKMLWAAPYFALTVILGISGVRYLLDLIVPMFIAAICFLLGSKEFTAFRKTPTKEQFGGLLRSYRASYVYVGAMGSFGALIGYLLNAVFISKQYQFQTYDTTNFIAIQEGVFFDRVQNALGELLQMFGYIENKAFLSLRGLVTMVAFVVIAILGYVWKKCMTYRKSQVILASDDTKEEYRSFTVLFAGISLVLHLFVFVFTTSTMVDRYFIPIAIFFLIVIAIYMEWETVAFDRVVVGVLLLACLLFAGTKTYYSFITNDKNETRYEMAEYLVEEGYRFGYASYWNSNIMTELSDGELEMANLWSIASMGDFKWSSKASSYDKKDGKVFLIANVNEINELEAYELLEKQPVIFENKDYIVLHFDNQAEFFASVGRLDIETDNIMENADAINF